MVRCRKNALAHARFPPGFPRLPYVGEGWHAKPAVAHMLEKGIATWNDFAWSLYIYVWGHLW